MIEIGPNLNQALAGICMVLLFSYAIYRITGGGR